MTTRSFTYLGSRPDITVGQVVVLVSLAAMDPDKVDWEASTARSKERCKPPPPEAFELLKKMHESVHVWYELRRHGDVQKCLKWLNQLAIVSTHDRNSEYEQQRRQYLHLLDEVKRWD